MGAGPSRGLASLERAPCLCTSLAATPSVERGNTLSHKLRVAAYCFVSTGSDTQNVPARSRRVCGSACAMRGTDAPTPGGPPTAPGDASRTRAGHPFGHSLGPTRQPQKGCVTSRHVPSHLQIFAFSGTFRTPLSPYDLPSAGHKKRARSARYGTRSHVHCASVTARKVRLPHSWEICWLWVANWHPAWSPTAQGNGILNLVLCHHDCTYDARGCSLVCSGGR